MASAVHNSHEDSAALWRTSIDAPSLLHNLQDTGIIAQLLRHSSHELEVPRVVGYSGDQRKPYVLGLPPLYERVG